MSFLAPWFAAFGILFVVPIVIHLIGRQSAQHVKFAAMALLLGSDRRSARWVRVRELLLLGLRALAIAAVPLIIARPFTERASPAEAAIGPSESAVIIVDDSLSMSYRIGDSTMFERARERARRLVDAMGRDATAALLLGSREGAIPVAELTGDRARLEQAIADLRPSERGTDLDAALRRAGQILGGVTHGVRRVYLISDLSAHGFGKSPLWGAAAATSLQLIDVRATPDLPNHAITRLDVLNTSATGSTGVRVAAEVSNFAATLVAGLKLTLRVDGKPVSTESLSVAANGRTVKPFFHSFADGSGPGALHDLSVELEPDALAEDDTRYARVEATRSLRVLVVDGEPRVSRRDDEVFYLTTALVPDPANPRVQVTTARPDGWEARRLQDYDVIFLCNLAAPALEQPLRDFLTRGGGVFISLGENVDVDSYNIRLRDLLPEPLQVIYSASGAGESLGPPTSHHPVLGPLTHEALGAAHFSRYALLRPDPDHHAEVLLRFHGGAPALVERRVGRGHVLLFASTIDRDWNDLPIQPVFLPLVQQATRFLAGAPEGQPLASTLVGEPHQVAARQGDTRVEVTDPGGATELLSVTAGHGITYVKTLRPGIYRVRAGGADGPVEPRPEASFVVNVDPAEADLARIDGKTIAALSRGSAGSAGGVRPKRRVELWHAMGAILLALLFLESLVLSRRS